MKQRLASIDVVRLIGLVAIVWGHSFPNSEFGDRAVQSWRLPIFFVLTGYFWSGRRSLREVVRTRFHTLLVPYAAWAVLITALSLPKRLDGGLKSVAHSIALGALGGSYATRPYTTFWFFTALFTAVVIYRVLQQAPAAVRLLIIGAGLIVNLVAGAQVARVPLALGTALGTLIFIETGHVVRLLQNRLTTWGRGLAALTLALPALVVLLLTPGDFVPMDMKVGQFPLPAVVVALSLGSAIVLSATMWTSLPTPLARTATTLARPSLVVIILHPLLLLYLDRRATDIPLVLVFAAALLVPMAVGLLLMRTRFAPLLLGIDTQSGLRRQAQKSNSAVADPELKTL